MFLFEWVEMQPRGYTPVGEISELAGKTYHRSFNQIETMLQDRHTGRGIRASHLEKGLGFGRRQSPVLEADFGEM